MSEPAASRSADRNAFLAKQTSLFALRCAKFLPTPYQAEDNNRMTLAYFCLSSLALLPATAVSSAATADQSALDVLLKPAQIQGFRDWVYEQQLPTGGFRGSDSLASTGTADLDTAHVIQSYTALIVLGILGDDYARLDRPGLLRFIGDCQQEDGSFAQFPKCEEPGDPRSTYSAFAIASMLDNWTSIDVDRGLAFLDSCRSDASSAAGDDDEVPVELAERAGFQGRANKPTDACYSFWSTAAIHLLLPALDPSLTLDQVVDPALDRAWLLSCQHPLYGGIAREPGALPDVYHTYLSLAALSLGDAGDSASQRLGLRALDAAWNVSRAVKARMREQLRADGGGS
ncbi:hypothetical protein Rhopal_002136-T1 [Rhodotorula paludigena]|uniref:Prenyltransferase alpha-alpha toroid domain-containing protein n=1 Tax=Rhodotorula paludigena TaxID=86838 RepID=A0AAV5GIG6_9BASI|nr:hypothetical protein Rhopal_002136-T1 [Rhodotorula paludigena]